MFETKLQMLLKKYSSQLKGSLGRGIINSKAVGWDLCVQAKLKDIIGVLFFLKNSTSSRFRVLVDIAVQDHPKNKERFLIVYNLLSLKYGTRLLLSTSIREGSVIPSCTHIFPGANWFEREVWDMFGIFFRGHPDLRRILTDYGFEGHPLRKDFPLTGYIETRYDVGQARIVYEPVELAQEYRDFSFSSP